MKIFIKTIVLVSISFIGYMGTAQTPKKQKKQMEELMRKQDSVMNSPQMKEMMQKIQEMQKMQDSMNAKYATANETKSTSNKNNADDWYWQNTLASTQGKFNGWSRGVVDIVMTYKGVRLQTFKIGSIKEDGSIIFNLPSSVNTKTTFERQMGPQGLFFDIYGNSPINYTNKKTGFITNTALLIMKDGKTLGNLTIGNSVRVTKNLTTQSGIDSGDEGYILYWAYANENCALVMDQEWSGKVYKDGTNSLDVKTNVNYDLHFKPGWNLVKTEVIGKYPLEHERGLDVSWFKNHRHTVISSLPSDAIYYFRAYDM